MANPGVKESEGIKRKAAIEAALQQGYLPMGMVAKRDGIDRSAIAVAADELGMSAITLATWVGRNRDPKFKPDWDLWINHRAPAYPKPPAYRPGFDLVEAVRKASGRPAGATLDGIAKETGADLGQILDAIDTLKSQGIAIKRVGERYELERAPQPAFAQGHAAVEVMSDKDNCFKFGAIGDNHAASRRREANVAYRGRLFRSAMAVIKRLVHRAESGTSCAPFVRCGLAMPAPGAAPVQADIRVYSSTARRDGSEIVLSLATDTGFKVYRLRPSVAASHVAHLAQTLGALATPAD